MNGHRHRSIPALAAAVALAGALTVSASTATAAGSGPLLAASPSTNLDNGTGVQVSLSGADSYDGQQVAFAECNEATAQSYGGNYGPACTAYKLAATVSNGSATGVVTAVYGQLPGDPDPSNTCTEANNGTCDIVAFAVTNSGPSKIAATPITFRAPQATTVTVTPSTNLDDGDPVAVSVTDIPNGAGSRIDLDECNTDAAADQGSYFYGACQFLAEGTSADNAYSSQVNVIDGFLNTSVACDENTPSDHCVIAALDHDNQTVLATTPITFEPQDLHVTVTPSTGLKDGQAVKVTASGISSEDSGLYVLECNTAYAAAHDGYQNLEACANEDSLPVSEHAVSTTLAIVDGNLTGSASGPGCTYANNGECAIVLLSERYHADTGTVQYEVVGSPIPISFRPPVTGPATITASPASGLHAGSTVNLALSGPEIPDGVEVVRVLECNIADVPRRGYNDACLGTGAARQVIDNVIPQQKISIIEGLVGNAENPSHCDYTHACELGIFTDPGGGAQPVPVSNLVRVWFRNPNIGRPVVAVSPHRGLKPKQTVRITLSKIPDLVNLVYLEECNLAVPKHQQQGDGPPCVYLNRSAVFIHGNAAHATVKVRNGLVGYKNTKQGGKKVFCNSSTNGQCVIVAFQPQSEYGAPVGVIARSSAITFAKTTR